MYVSLSLSLRFNMRSYTTQVHGFASCRLWSDNIVHRAPVLCVCVCVCARTFVCVCVICGQSTIGGDYFVQVPTCLISACGCRAAKTYNYIYSDIHIRSLDYHPTPLLVREYPHKQHAHTHTRMRTNTHTHTHSHVHKHTHTHIYFCSVCYHTMPIVCVCVCVCPSTQADGSRWLTHMRMGCDQ